MELIPRDPEAKPIRHTYDKSAFRRYSVRLLIWPFVALIIQMLPLMLFPDRHDVLSFIITGALPGLTLLWSVISFFTIFYTIKSSDVFTTPGCVLYRKKRLFFSQFYGVHYIVYYITNVKKVSGEEKYPEKVKGDIKAAFVHEDGQTIHSIKKCRRVSIPPCFTDMELIRETLTLMEIDHVNTSSEYITF